MLVTVLKTDHCFVYVRINDSNLEVITSNLDNCLTCALEIKTIRKINMSNEMRVRTLISIGHRNAREV